MSTSIQGAPASRAERPGAGRSRVDRADAATVTLSPELQVTVARVRDEVSAMHDELVRAGLVTGRDGAVSGRVPGTDLFVVRPEGLAATELGPESLVLCDLDGRVVPDTPGDDRAPVAAALVHAELYRRLEAVGGIAHTRSTHATAWAARGEAIPCVLVVTAEHFGGSIPVAELDTEHPADAIAAALAGQRSPAALVRASGAIAVGADAREAVESAIALEDVARTTHAARAGGPVAPLDDALIDILWTRHRAGPPDPPPFPG